MEIFFVFILFRYLTLFFIQIEYTFIKNHYFKLKLNHFIQIKKQKHINIKSLKINIKSTYIQQNKLLKFRINTKKIHIFTDFYLTLQDRRNNHKNRKEQSYVRMSQLRKENCKKHTLCAIPLRNMQDRAESDAAISIQDRSCGVPEPSGHASRL